MVSVGHFYVKNSKHGYKAYYKELCEKSFKEIK